MPSKPANFEVANASGATVRGDINDIFDAIGRNNGYGSVPTTPLPYMWYANTSTGRLGFYKAVTSSGRHEFISLADGNFYGPDGSAGSPSYTFSNSASTGFYRSASNQIGVSVNGSMVTEFKADVVEFAENITVTNSGADSQFQVSTGVNDQDAIIDLAADTTYPDYGLRLRRIGGATSISEMVHRGTGYLQITTQEAAPIVFSTTSANRFEIKSGGSFCAIGASFANATLTNGGICGKGFGTRTGADTDSGNNNAASASTGNLFNFYWDGNNAHFYIDNTRLGAINSSTTSDYRIKRDITTLAVDGIERVKKLRPVTFKYRDYDIYKQSEAVHEGFIAHEVGEVIPDACKGTKDEGLQLLEIAPIVSTLTKALQEAVAKIETLETKVAALEAG
tara:strand:+ start:5416 stop:6597 length:1182 start_codon:yes stop_codon:yes gene_type:complete